MSSDWPFTWMSEIWRRDNWSETESIMLYFFPVVFRSSALDPFEFKCTYLKSLWYISNEFWEFVPKYYIQHFNQHCYIYEKLNSKDFYSSRHRLYFSLIFWFLLEVRWVTFKTSNNDQHFDFEGKRNIKLTVKSHWCYKAQVLHKYWMRCPRARRQIPF